MEKQPASYKKLLKRAREIALLGSANSALAWDQETYMPPRALAYRAEQMAYLSGEAHRLFIAKKVGELIRDCEQQGFPDGSGEAANVREWRRHYDRATRLPPHGWWKKWSEPVRTPGRPGDRHGNNRNSESSVRTWTRSWR